MHGWGSGGRCVESRDQAGRKAPREKERDKERTGWCRRVLRRELGPAAREGVGWLARSWEP
eukprot:3153859-Alexandrium_andersonii.AAC.1